MRSNNIIDIDKPLQEKCGIVGIYTLTYTKKLHSLLSAAGGVQHRGQQGVGLAVQSTKGLKSFTDNGLLTEVFTPDIFRKYNLSCQWSIIHCRYGTNGGYDKRNLQPCIIKTKDKKQFAIAHNGEFVDTLGMRQRISKKFPESISDTYLFAELINLASGASAEEKLVQTLSMVKGAYSLIIGVEDKLFLARDQFGLRPLVIGAFNEGWIAASETHALDKIGAKLIREVKRGEIVRIDTSGITVIRRGLTGPGNFCDFEWAYFGRPDSQLNVLQKKQDGGFYDKWSSVNFFRERCGQILAEESPIKKATFVVGVPDSGIAIATGYSSALKLPYRQVILRDHFDRNGTQRLFMRDDQMKRIKKKVLGKLSLIPDREIWKDAIVVIGDDSIVRGNVSQKITQAIFALGAKEVHWIIGFPPVRYSCHLGVSIRMKSELIAADYAGDAKKIAKALGATSVSYISARGFIKARLFTNNFIKPKNSEDVFLMNSGCGGCVTGKYPVTAEGVLVETG